MKYRTLVAFVSFAIPSTAALASPAPALSQSTFNGVDQNGQACSISFERVSFGKTVMASSCDFETDGEGPWCSTAKTIPTRAVRGSGSFSSVAGDMSFELNDNSVQTESSPIGIAAGAAVGGTVSLTLANDSQLKADYAFLSEYGQSLSAAQRNNEIMNRAPGVSYEDAYHKIYVDVTCRAQR